MIRRLGLCSVSSSLLRRAVISSRMPGRRRPTQTRAVLTDSFSHFRKNQTPTWRDFFFRHASTEMRMTPEIADMSERVPVLCEKLVVLDGQQAGGARQTRCQLTPVNPYLRHLPLQYRLVVMVTV